MTVHQSVRVDLKFSTSRARAQALLRLGFAGLAPVFDDLASLDVLVLLPALAGGGAWLAPAWPRFGTVVAGLCQRASMDAAMRFTRYTLLSLSFLLSIHSTLRSSYSLIYKLCCCFLLVML
jgi:hypothetical protein